MFRGTKCHVISISLSKKRSWSNLDIFSCDFACSCVFANKRVIITNLLLIWHRINYIANGHFTQFLNAIRLQNGLKSSLHDMSQVFLLVFYLENNFFPFLAIQTDLGRLIYNFHSFKVLGFLSFLTLSKVGFSQKSKFRPSKRTKIADFDSL